jgi:putative FmdB family regulatory protein
MPIFEYRCERCRHEFEALVRGDNTPRCPSCQSAALERRISTFSVDSQDGRAASLKAARQANLKVERDKAVAHREEIERHRH